MHSFIPRCAGIAALLCSTLAAAAPVDLGAASAYNLVSFGDFHSTGNSVAGSVAVAGDLTARNMGLNGTRLVVGGDLAFASGSIAGNATVGGTRSLQSASIAGQWLTGTALDFSALVRQMHGLSANLADVRATGRAASQYGGLYLTGTGSTVEVFDLGLADISGVGWSNISGLLPGASIVFNIGGSDVRLVSGMLNGLDSRYNVLLNFYEAQTLTLQNIGLTASILAPHATLGGSNARVNGNVVAGDWRGGITLVMDNPFRSNDVAGYSAPLTTRPGPIPNDAGQANANAVPEPGNLALTALGLGLLAWSRRRAQRYR